MRIIYNCIFLAMVISPMNTKHRRQIQFHAFIFSACISAASQGQTLTEKESADAAELDALTVTGDYSQVELTDVFAGGQVARGGRAGLLGNLDYLDSPFSGSAYTQELIQAQQAESIGDVLLNEPAVRVTKGFGNFQEVYMIRGFPVFSDDLTLNGLYGILPRQFVAAELLERVEVFRGANAFINGAAPGSSGSGGTVNLVPKRATGQGFSRLTLGFEQAGQWYGAVDHGARFGRDQAWGVRINAIGRNGETAVNDEERDLTALSFGTDFRGERLQLSADLGYQDNRIDRPRPQVTPLGAVPIAPRAEVNYAQPGTFTDEEQLFGVLRAEYHFSDRSSAWLAFGGRSGEERNVLANPSVLADGTTTAYRFDNAREDGVFSADAGWRGVFDTGAVQHAVVLSAARIDSESDNAFALSSFLEPFAGNLYAPVPLAALPAADFFTGGDLNHPLTTERVKNSSLALADTLSIDQGHWLLTAGLRHQRIETRTFDYNNGEVLSAYDESKITPVFGAVYRPSAALAWYGNYAENLQAGAVAPASSGGVPIDNAGEALDPFNGAQLELGVKYEGTALGAGAALFSVTQQSALVENNRFQAAGEQRNQGVELHLFGEAAEGVRLLGGVTLIDAQLRHTEGGVNEGNSAIGVPDWQLNLNAEWDLPFVDGLTLDARLVHSDEQWADAANTVALKAWSRFDLGVRYATELGGRAVTFRARLDNLTNKGYWASSGGFPGANYLIQGAPRTLFMTASVDL